MVKTTITGTTEQHLALDWLGILSMCSFHILSLLIFAVAIKRFMYKTYKGIMYIYEAMCSQHYVFTDVDIQSMCYGLVDHVAYNIKER